MCSNRKIFIKDVLDIGLSFSTKKIEVHDETPAKLRITDEDVIRGDNSKLKELGFQITQTTEELLKEMFDYWIKYFKNQ